MTPFETNERFYFEEIPGLGMMTRSCPRGSQYNPGLCTCDRSDEVRKKSMYTINLIFHMILILDYWSMVLNVTFNKIPVISWQSVFLLEETGAPGENHRPGASH